MVNDVKLAISDLQIPFQHRDALDFVIHVKKTFYKPGDVLTVINEGDEVDQHTLSKYAADPNGRSAGDELHEAKIELKPWFAEFPVMLICESNHTYRGYKKGFEAGIPSEFFRTLNEVYEAPPRWKWKDRWVIDDVVYEHGENVSGPTAALNAAIHNRMSTVIGHQHSHGGVVHSGSFHNTIWGLNTGCLIDVDKYAFKYGNKIRRKPTLGMGVIFNGIPIFVPMILDKNKRWVKRL